MGFQDRTGCRGPTGPANRGCRIRRQTKGCVGWLCRACGQRTTARLFGMSAGRGHRLRVSLRRRGIDPVIQMLGLCCAGHGTPPQDAPQSVEHQVTRLEGILPSHPSPDLALVAADGAASSRCHCLPNSSSPRAASILRCSHAQPSGNAPASRHASREPAWPFGRHPAACLIIGLRRSQYAPGSGEARLVRAVAAVDTGQTVNPDGLRNQIEGGILQLTSWTLHEQVTFGSQPHHQRRLTGRPIPSCGPTLCPRTSKPISSIGPVCRSWAAARRARGRRRSRNAIANTTGRRCRELPLTAAWSVISRSTMK